MSKPQCYQQLQYEEQTAIELALIKLLFPSDSRSLRRTQNPQSDARPSTI